MRIAALRAHVLIVAIAAGAAILGAGSRPAGADTTPSTADKALAEVLFRDGRELFEQGNFDEACPKLAESHRLEPKPGTILNVAFCHEQQGKIATAWTEFMEAATLAARAKQAEREKAARERIAALEARLSKITIEVAEPAPGIVVKLDDRALAAAVWTSAIPLDPGEHTVTASAPGRKTWTTKVKIEADRSMQTVSIPPLAAVASSADPRGASTGPGAPGITPPAPGLSASASATAGSPDAPSSGIAPGMIAGFAAGGIGVAGIVVGSIFGARTFSKKSAGDAECDGRYCSQAGLDLHNDAETSATISTIGFGVGIAGVGAGIALVLLSRGSSPQRPAASRIWIAPGAFGLGSGDPSIAAGGVF